MSTKGLNQEDVKMILPGDVVLCAYPHRDPMYMDEITKGCTYIVARLEIHDDATYLELEPDAPEFDEGASIRASVFSKDHFMKTILVKAFKI